jgi:hypothetical protein
MTANRSGWLGIILIAAMLAWVQFSLRTAVLVGTGAVLIWFLMSETGVRDIVQWKIDQTENEYSSDVLRRDLVTSAFELGAENPVFGVGPQELPYRLARTTHADMPFVDVHNVFGYLAGGFGFLAFAAAGAFMFTVVFPGRIFEMKRYRGGLELGRMIVVLFIVRGLFSREVLYAPAMCLSLGIALGLCVVNSQGAMLSALPRTRFARSPR